MINILALLNTESFF